MKSKILSVFFGVVIVFSVVISCSKKETLSKKFTISRNYGIDEQDKLFLTNDESFENDIISNIHDVAREMNIKNSSGVMIELNGKDSERAKQIILEHLTSNGIEQNKINFQLNETQSDTTTIKILLK